MFKKWWLLLEFLQTDTVQSGVNGKHPCKLWHWESLMFLIMVQYVRRPHPFSSLCPCLDVLGGLGQNSTSTFDSSYSQPASSHSPACHKSIHWLWPPHYQWSFICGFNLFPLLKTLKGILSYHRKQTGVPAKIPRSPTFLHKALALRHALALSLPSPPLSLTLLSVWDPTGFLVFSDIH